MTEETRRLYFNDPYQVEFEANVAGRTEKEGKPAIIIDQTCFYPESGGQPSDRGTINGIEVIDVKEEEGKVLHVIAEDIKDKRIHGFIDWETRFDHMQQHGGQHILSQSFYELLDGETRSFHLSQEVSTLEIGLSKISEQEAEDVERRANKIVFQNREIKTSFVPQEKIDSIPLRRPPKKEGLIRVVEISDYDYSACGGTHPRSTGEIGLIKILKWERIRDNIRFEFVCGSRALRDYALRNRILRQVALRFTSGEEEVLSAMEKVFSDLKDQKKKNKKMLEKILQFEAQEVIHNRKERIIKNVFSGRTVEEIRLLALNIIKKGEFVVLFGLVLEKRVHLILACSESVDIDMRDLLSLVSPLIKGRGGGRSSLVEIAGEETENLKLALDEAYNHIKTLDI